MLGNLFNTKVTAKEFLKKNLQYLIEKGGFELSFEIEQNEEGLFVDIFGKDEGLLKTKDGRVLMAFQSYFSKTIQNKFSEENISVVFDSNGFWEERREGIFLLVDNLINEALETRQSVVLKKSLSPYERKLIYEKISNNSNIESQSIGVGTYKGMKFTPRKHRQ